MKRKTITKTIKNKEKIKNKKKKELRKIENK